MPTIKVINGIKVVIYYLDHNPPHLHTQKGRTTAVIDLRTLEVTKGTLSSKDLKDIKQWMQQNQTELLALFTKAQKGESIE